MATFAENRPARATYEILETIEAGIELLGFEVKSVRAGRMSLRGSYVTIRGGEAYLVGTTVPAFQPGNTPADFDPVRYRRLLLSKAELHDMAGKTDQKGLTLVPLSVYNRGTKIKLQLGLGRGKKVHDKRQALKKRAAAREAERSLKIY